MTDRRTRGRVLVLVTASLGALSCRGTLPTSEPCFFPDAPRSMVAWGTPSVSDSSFAGHVIDVQMRPVPSATARLTPGDHRARVDDQGRFRFEGLPRGRYDLRVRAIGFAEASATVTYSEFGTKVVIVLSPNRPGLDQCIRTGLSNRVTIRLLRRGPVTLPWRSWPVRGAPAVDPLQRRPRARAIAQLQHIVSDGLSEDDVEAELEERRSRLRLRRFQGFDHDLGVRSDSNDSDGCRWRRLGTFISVLTPFAIQDGTLWGSQGGADRG